MKLKITGAIYALLLPILLFSQQTSPEKRFNDWSVSAGTGIPLMQSSDLTSIKGFGAGQNLLGWSAYLSVDRAVTHAFGLKLQYDKGESKQGFVNTKDHAPSTGAGARTQYDAISILGDVNFSNLLRRVDNHSPFRWALHGYAGVGSLAYRAYRQDPGLEYNQHLVTEVKPFTLGSMFAQAGAGLKYRATKSVDIEGRAMYLLSGDDSFDGAGGTSYNGKRNDNPSDNLVNITLGATFNIGKHESHLFWHDPLQEIYFKLDVLADRNQDIVICKKGDVDNDGVCDDWDRQLNTPAGARVDGAGVALDIDLDGIIDLYDKCVTVPGPIENNGCPIKTVETTSISDNAKFLEAAGVEFDLNSTTILPSDFQLLDNLVPYLKSSTKIYNIIGTTDARGALAYNKKLSERRANNVRNYLVEKGVQPEMLKIVASGKKDLKYPECDPATKCPEWKNRANRRVYLIAK